MKTINHNDWTLHNKLRTSMFKPEPPIETYHLMRKFRNSFELALFYYRLDRGRRTLILNEIQE